jgi:hypothetical protein
MARYSALLRRRVEVQYRAGDILLPASGTLVADSGRSIFLEQNLTQQGGQQKYFRWEIPYQYIVRIEDRPEALKIATESTPALGTPSRHSASTQAATATAAGISSGRTPYPPLRKPAKTV